jgi:peptidoglycan-associated lipoprotein
MRSKALTQIAVLALVATIGLVGCKKKTQPPTGPVGPGSGVTDNTTPPPINSTDISGTSGTGSGERPILSTSDLEKRGLFAAVYFDLDSAVIKSAEKNKLGDVAAALKGNSKKLVVEGHCDERGTEEYNRALGERRARAAQTELEKLGIDASRISTISYGKDKPVELLHDAAAWSKNRRCEFVIVGQ